MSRYGPERPPLPFPNTLRKDFLLRMPPAKVIYILIILVVASFLPLALLAKARFSNSPLPPVHIIQDMDNQPRYNTQAANPLFADGRAMRQPVPGTVARGHLDADDHYYRGFSQVKNEETGQWEVKYFQAIPPQITVDKQTMERGRTLFAIYCAPCHGLDGHGQGQIFLRAQKLNQGSFVPPADLHSPDIRGRADGHLYNTIRNGVRNMPAYGSQINTQDRWAVVAYLRALLLSQHATLEDVPPEQRDNIR